MSLLLDRKLKNKEKKTSRTGWTFLTIQRFVISLDYLGFSWVEDEEKLQIGFLLLFAIIWLIWLQIQLTSHASISIPYLLE